MDATSTAFAEHLIEIAGGLFSGISPIFYLFLTLIFGLFIFIFIWIWVKTGVKEAARQIRRTIR